MKWKLGVAIGLAILGVGLAVLVLTKVFSVDALVYARGTDSTTLDPAEVEYGEDAKVTENIFETLVGFKGDTTGIEPRLATSWTVADGGKKWAFQLRKGVKFHDGTDLDAGDVVFTFDRILKPDHPHRPKGVPYGEIFGFIEKVEASGDAVVFTLKQPNATFLQVLALFGAAIVGPEAVKKHGPGFSRNPCGTGPYRLHRWRQGEKLVLERFGDYWGPKPAISRVVFLPVASAQTAIEKLKNGEVHIVDHVTLADVKIVESSPGMRIESETSLNVCYLGFNSKKFPYNDPNFRRAVALAIDRDELNQIVYYGQGEPARNLVPPAIWRDIGDLPTYEFNIEKAKDHLKKVDLPPDFRPELWHMAFARPYVPEPDRLAEYVRNQLRKIGLELAIQKFEKAAWGEKTKDPDHPMYILGWSADYADPDNFYHALLAGGAKNELNSSFWEHAEFNDLVVRAQSEQDERKRKDLYLRAAMIYREEMPTLPLVHVKQLAACSRKVKYDLHPIEVRLYPVTFQNP
ncbi:MAG: ABC transporter substrate-binding protein [Planctomycetes bacterium]|nr:ABC transporter substrate-binding protein [Planctomycetota bacterium]